MTSLEEALDDDRLEEELGSAVDEWLEEETDSELSDETLEAELDSELVWDSLDDRLVERLDVLVTPVEADVVRDALLLLL